MAEIGEQWRNLTDTEKQVYVDRANKAKEEYEKKLTAWEQKMMLEGREDLVRKVPPKEPKRQSRVRTFFANSELLCHCQTNSFFFNENGNSKKNKMFKKLLEYILMCIWRH